MVDVDLYNKAMELYDNEEDAANALLAEGVNILEKMMFYQGEVLYVVTISPDKDMKGYDIDIQTNRDFYEMEDSFNNIDDDDMERGIGWDDILS